MTDEEELETMDEKDAPDETSSEVEEETIETEAIEEKPVEEIKTVVEEPCDPMKMNCDELGDHIIELVDKRSKYTDTLDKLDEVKKVIPSETIDQIYDETTKEKQAIDDEMYLVIEKAIACRTLKPVEEKPVEETTETEEEPVEVTEGNIDEQTE